MDGVALDAVADAAEEFVADVVEVEVFVADAFDAVADAAEEFVADPLDADEEFAAINAGLGDSG